MNIDVDNDAIRDAVRDAFDDAWLALTLIGKAQANVSLDRVADPT